MRTTMRMKHQNNLIQSIERQYFSLPCSNYAITGKEDWDKNIENKRFCGSGIRLC